VFPNLLLAFTVPAALLVAGYFVGGAGLAAGHVLWETTLQRRIPADALSRVSSYDWFGSLLFNPLGLALAGPVSQAIGTEAALVIAATYLGVSGLAVAALPAVRAVHGG
jgi:hypothetical protein